MCDIKKISREKDMLLKDIDETLTLSGATIIRAEQEMKEVRKKARENIRKLSLLL